MVTEEWNEMCAPMGSMHMVAKGVKKIGKFAIKQLHHPAVGRFVADQAAIAASTGFNPEVAAPLMGARAAQEGLAIAERTARHFGRS